jgi:hypothetical protein
MEGRVSTSVGLFSQVFPQEGNEHGASRAEGMAGEGVAVEMEDLEGGTVDDDAAREKRALKRERQWRKWSEDVIPALLQPYMALLRETEGLRDINSKRQADGCTGCSVGRLLEVTCVYFESKIFLGLFLLL